MFRWLQIPNGKLLSIYGTSMMNNLSTLLDMMINLLYMTITMTFNHSFCGTFHQVLINKYIWKNVCVDWSEMISTRMSFNRIANKYKLIFKWQHSIWIVHNLWRRVIGMTKESFEWNPHCKRKVAELQFLKSYTIRI